MAVHCPICGWLWYGSLTEACPRCLWRPDDYDGRRRTRRADSGASGKDHAWRHERWAGGPAPRQGKGQAG